MHYVRRATEDDADSINQIYNHYVLTSTCTFHLEPVTHSERLDWLRDHDDRFAIFVGVIAEDVVGWASLSPHRTRPAYAGTVESSVYIHKDYHRQGIGQLLMINLIEHARLSGFHTLIAGTEASQAASLLLHESLGFEKIARFKEVGYKFDQWLDTVFLKLML
jgi:L-amino acid N-acyltransferase YncA